MKKFFKLLTLVVATMCSTSLFAISLQVGGVTVSSSNADDVLGDGKVSYDASTNTLTLNSVGQKSMLTSLIQVANDTKGISIDEKTPLILNCLGTNTYSGTKSGTIGINYPGAIVIDGNGLLNMTTDSTAIICKHLKVSGGTAVELCRNTTGYGYTLRADSISVESSVLYVHKGAHAYGVASTTTYFSIKNCYSNANLLHKSEETRVREKYKYAYNQSSHTWEYRYRTVSKWTNYDGWYDSSNSEVSELKVLPEAYSVSVDGVQVTRYNYVDVLGNGYYKYDPFTKTLTKSVQTGNIEFSGYLSTVDSNSKQEDHWSETNGEGQQIEVSMPEYMPEYSNEKDEVYLYFWTMTEDYQMNKYLVKESGEVTFPGLEKGKITFDKETSTLTLDNVECSCESGIFAMDHSLTINLIGTNTFYSVNNTELSIQAYQMSKFVITGTGSLECTFLNVQCCDSVFIQDGCTLITNFVAGSGIMTIDNSTLELNGDTLFNNYSGIHGFYELNLIDVAITNDSISFKQSCTPYKSYDDHMNPIIKYSSDGTLVDIDGAMYKGTLTIAPKKEENSVPSINASTLTEWNPNAPKYDLLGRPVNDGYKGIFIQNGKKFMFIDQ